mgnify:CR=1 FL=1
MRRDDGHAFAVMDMHVDDAGHGFDLAFQEEFAAAARHSCDAYFCVKMFGFGHRRVRIKIKRGAGCSSGIRGVPFSHNLRTMVPICMLMGGDSAGGMTTDVV